MSKPNDWFGTKPPDFRQQVASKAIRSKLGGLNMLKKMTATFAAGAAALGLAMSAGMVSDVEAASHANKTNCAFKRTFLQKHFLAKWRRSLLMT